MRILSLTKRSMLSSRPDTRRRVIMFEAGARSPATSDMLFPGRIFAVHTLTSPRIQKDLIQHTIYYEEIHVLCSRHIKSKLVRDPLYDTDYLSIEFKCNLFVQLQALGH